MMMRASKTVIPLIAVLAALCIVVVLFKADGLAFNTKFSRASDDKDAHNFRQTIRENEPKDRMLTDSSLFRERIIDQMQGVSVSKGKTKVYRHNGKELERLNDFCTWTLPMDCANLKIPGGDSMTIFIHDVRDDPGLSGVLKESGIRDPENVEIVINELKKYPDAGFFDFGSHIGVYALSIAHTLKRPVVAIDPMIENVFRMCKSVQFNNLTDKMTIVFNPISNEITKVNFHRVHNHIGATTVLKNSAPQESSCDDTENFSVMMNNLIPIVPFTSAVMKLDVEKSEYFAVQGGLRFLQEINVHSILMEWYNIVKTPHAEPLVELLKELKYVPYIPYANGDHKLVKYEDYKTWTKLKDLLDVLWVKQT